MANKLKIKHLRSRSGEAEAPLETRLMIASLQNRLRAYKDTVENATEGIIQTTQEGKFLYVNPAFASMLGYSSPFELIQRVNDIGTQIYVNATDRQLFMTELEKGGVYRYEYQAFRKDGSKVWLHVSARRVYNSQSEFLYYESIVEDTTERREREAQLRELTESLKRSNQELERFARVVAHDLRDPLCTVQSFCELIAENSGQFDEETKQHFKFIVSAVDRMQGMIYDILDICRLEVTRLQREKVRTDDLLKAVIGDLEVAVRASQAHITWENLPENLYVDREKIHRVFQNLIRNSIKFRGDSPLHVTISAHYVAPFWTFSVQDNGMGFDMKYKDYVFEMFSRLNHSKKCEGSGMGLALCRKIVELHDGKIWVESVFGSGTTVYFTLRDA